MRTSSAAQHHSVPNLVMGENLETQIPRLHLVFDSLIFECDGLPF